MKSKMRKSLFIEEAWFDGEPVIIRIPLEPSVLSFNDSIEEIHAIEIYRGY